MNRIPGRNFLFVPGPTNVPDRVQRAMMVAMEDHRSSRFPDLTKSLFEDLKKVFKTESGKVFMFPSTGTGAWEAAITNTLSYGDKVLTFRFGQFSHLWADMMVRLGLEPEIVDVPWGEGVPSEQLHRILEQDSGHAIKAVFVCHNETATGVTSDIHAVRMAIDAAKHPALLLVDTVSSLGSIDFQMDAWQVDVVVSGSQKGLMLPAGLGLLAMSEKAMASRATANMKRCYFDLDDMIRSNPAGYFPYTPPLPLLYGLRESLNIIFEEGLEEIFARHHRLAQSVRNAVLQGWKLSLCANDPKWWSDTVSAVLVPEGINGAHVIDVAFRRYNLALGAGLSQMAGKLFRIGHLGDLNELMVLGALSGAEMAMKDVGINIELGSGVAAAQRYLRDSDPEPKKRVSR
ncbi:MAG: aminotransferase class V-fold PLP-dependent enzyme, partial [Betaproteobacteria bacterium]|nr:aminotransferase class V-fold PLP-dependent enzyme [Betaproteobacteria bacterium]